MITIQTLATDWQTVATFDPLVINIDVITTCALHIADELVNNEMCFISNVCVVDDETGEVFWSCVADCQPFEEPDDGDDDCCFEPGRPSVNLFELNP